jgi:hypothetical protein
MRTCFSVGFSSRAFAGDFRNDLTIKPMTTKWNPSDDQERLGVFLAGQKVSSLGHIFREQTTNDVGIDAHVEVVDQSTRCVSGQLLALQIKAGPSYFKEENTDGFVFRGDLNHLDYWLSHSLPVFLLLVDTATQKIYWQDITESNTERLNKGWKVTVPRINLLDTNFETKARERVGLDANAFSYTRLALQDTSNADAKRYCAKILMRAPITRLRAEAVARKATSDIRKERYNLDSFKKIFGDRDADVVSLFVAGDLQDVENANWYCRTLWVSNSLASDKRPSPIGGDDLGDGLEVVWKNEYANDADFYRSLQIDKQEYLTKVRSFTANTEALLEKTFGRGTTIICPPPAFSQYAVLMREVYIESNDIGLPPYECRDVAQQFEDVMALADNAFIYAKNVLNEPANLGWPVQLETELKSWYRSVGRLQYELEKIK